MDSRRNGLIAVVVLLIVAGALLYYQATSLRPAPTTAFAPAESADESVAPPEVAVEGTDVAAAPAAEEDSAGTAPAAGTDVAEDAAEVVPEAEGQAAEAAPEPAAGEAAPGGEAAGADVALADADAGAAAETAPAEETIVVVEPPPVPTFDIVRVEPSGETVIAGQADPNALVEIMDGAEVIASAEASDAGEWVIALEEPLDPGTHDLAISTTTEDGSVVTLSDERVTVSVPEEGSTDVLVVLNAPNAPSTILQVPPAGEAIASAEEQPAAGEGATPEASGGEVALAPPDAGQAGDTAAPAEETATEAATADAAPAAEEAAAGETEVALADTAGPAAEEPAEPQGLAAETASADDATAPAAPESPAAGEPGAETAAAGDEAATAENDVAAATTGVEEPASEQPASEAAVAGVAEAGPDATGADETDTAEAPAAATGEPAPEADVAAAAEEEGAPAETDVAAAAPTEEPAPPPPPPEPMVLVAAVEADTDGSLYVAGTATTGETVRVYLDGEHIGDAVPSPSGTWLIETIADLPAGEYLIRADQIGADGTVIARYEVPFDREVEVAVLKPTGAIASTESAAVAGAMPELQTVIIKRGDNLWRIARSTWGKGIRWSTIYQANTDLIRNPHLIYPGQVFVMPKSDATWEN